MLAATAAGAPQRPGPGAPAARRGEYVFRLAGGCGCHTDYEHKGAFLAGGRAIQTPFGTVYGTNITPHAETGLGRWTEQDFVRAMTLGVGKDGKDLYPVFPYPAFTRMSPADLKDLWAYLKTVPPVRQANREHQLRPPFDVRLGVVPWKAMNFTPGSFRADPAQGAIVNRGAYIVQAIAHCGECHTPRTLTGALKGDLAYAGSVAGPEGQRAPNLTPDPATGIGEWSESDIASFLRSGNSPSGHLAEGLMGEMIDHGFAHASEADLAAVAAFLKRLPPIVNKVEKPRPKARP